MRGTVVTTYAASDGEDTREVLAVHFTAADGSEGWAAPADVDAYVNGLLTAPELIARSQPAPPATTLCVFRADVVYRVEP